MRRRGDLFQGKYPGVANGTPAYSGVMRLSIGRLIALLVLLLALTGCSGHYPADPHGTLEHVTDGELRVGVSHSPPETDLGPNPPTGTEVDLVRQYAETVSAHVTWTPGGEEDLVKQLKNGHLDLVIGGLTKDSPWDTEVGITRGYAESTDEFGDTRKHVMAVRNGENAFLMDLEAFLADHGGRS